MFLLSSGPQAGRGWAGSGCSLSMQQHFIAQNHPSSPFAPVPHIPFVLPQGGTEELEESSQCTLPTVPPEGLHSPLGSSLPNAGGHRWRRTTTVLDVSQAWSKFALLAHPPVSQELFPGFLSLRGSPDIVGFVLLEISALLLSFSSHCVPSFVSLLSPFPPTTHVHEQICN